MFKVYDIDGDGLIQHRELQHVMRACMEENGMQFSEEQVRKCLNLSNFLAIKLQFNWASFCSQVLFYFKRKSKIFQHQKTIKLHLLFTPYVLIYNTEDSFTFIVCYNTLKNTMLWQ